MALTSFQPLKIALLMLSYKCLTCLSTLSNIVKNTVFAHLYCILILLFWCNIVAFMSQSAIPYRAVGVFLSLIVFAWATNACSGNRESGQKSSDPNGRALSFTGELAFLDEVRDTVSVIEIAVAANDSTRSLGLMDVRNLETSQGMLFIFDRQEVQSFWMANTPLPLDLLFADENRTIVHIHTNARPYSRSQIPSLYPAKYVVEVNAGYAMARDLQVGHTISYTITN
ncbi:MAG: hypothetical protein HLUCCA01_00370 [Bacteroidetes bacterium HLUCCA01]|nr:MAG: hypothetical protein HLUCCA01_00370 [Bacteroidetes bacterium HLUCCA01]